MAAQELTSERSWSVGSEFAGCRLETFIRAQLPFLSRRQLLASMREASIRVNGRRARKGDRIECGDVVRFNGPAAWLSPSPLPNPQLTVPVIYEDADIIVLNKPAGMACHGFSARDSLTLASFLLARWPQQIGIGNSRWEAGLAHRLDRETSGLVLAARSQKAFDHVRSQFRRRMIEKRYLALVYGRLTQEGSIDFPLFHDDAGKKMRALFPGEPRATKKKYWRALTYYRPVIVRQKWSLIEIKMETGVTHQIRAHLAAIRHPIVNDALYGVAGTLTLPALERHFLHASGLRFTHPCSQDSIEFEAPIPAELAAILEGPITP